jgi:hypothetical protein
MTHTDALVGAEPLYTSADIRGRIRRLFAPEHRRRRRIICVAYIGADCLDYIPFARGVKIYCSPQPGATIATGLDRLLAAGADLYFINGLHAKLYWTEGVGAVVGSPNLSANALGDEGLIEFALAIPDAERIKPENIIGQRRPRRVTPEAIEELRRAETLLRQSNPLPERRRPKHTVVQRPGSARTVSFTEWITFRGERRLQLLEQWDDYEDSADAKAFVKEKYGVQRPFEEVWGMAPDSVTAGSWVLSYERETGQVTGWILVTDVIRRPIKDAPDKEYPYLSLQVGDPRARPPFACDRAFKRAFKKAYDDWGGETKLARLGDDVAPRGFLRAIQKCGFRKI